MALITLLPLVWLLAVTVTAGVEKIWHSDPRIGFLTHAAVLQGRITSGEIAAAQLAETHALIFNDRLDAAVTGLFMVLVLVIVVDSLREWYRVLSAGRGGVVAEGMTATA
jgi:carbon starvation protein